MISVDAALVTYAEVLSPLELEQAATTQVLGRVLRAPAIAAVDLPRFDQSAMDGYAYAHDDHHQAMPCVGRAEAGGSPEPLQPGTCSRILTGAPMPAGADTVVAQEQVTEADGLIRFVPADVPGRHVRRCGEELTVGARLMASGAVVGAGAIAALCMAGIGQVTVSRQPRIAVLITGNEVRPVGRALAASEIYDANGPLIVAWLAQQGMQPTVVRSVEDSATAVDAALAAVADVDLVLSTGGASVGDRDFLPGAVQRAGFKTHFWKVAQKPGKPLLFASRGRQALLALPGNPAAVLVGLHVHAAMVLDVMSGRTNPGPNWQLARWAQAPKADQKRDRFVRAIVQSTDGATTELQLVPHQASHMISNLVHANALVRVPIGSDSQVAQYLRLA